MKINMNKGFIQIPILIAIIASVIVVSAITTVVILYSTGNLSFNNQTASLSEIVENGKEPQKEEQLVQEEENQDNQNKDEEEISQTERELEQLKLETEKAKQEAEKAKTEAERLKAQQIAQELTEKQRKLEERQKEEEIKKLLGKAKSQEPVDLASVIKQWKSYVVRIDCEFDNPSGNKVGSGLIFLNGEKSIVLTNAHVIFHTTSYAETVPTFCNVSFPGHGYLEIKYSNKIFSYILEKDIGIIKIEKPDDYINTLTFPSSHLCTEKPAIGDSVVILGYPGIGAGGLNITATEGIISGYEGDYFITSAKVEQGNSGGAAIWLKNNCYLGVPTFAVVGNVESLARILSINAVAAIK